MYESFLILSMKVYELTNRKGSNLWRSISLVLDARPTICNENLQLHNGYEMGAGEQST